MGGFPFTTILFIFAAVFYSKTFLRSGVYMYRYTVNSSTFVSNFYFLIPDCSSFTLVMPAFTLSEPPSIIFPNSNVTLQCTASAITNNASMYWVVDDVLYNTTSTSEFNTSRGQLVIEQSVLNLMECMISSSLTVFNVQMSSQGVYNCVVQDNNFTLSLSRLIMLNIQNSSSEGTYTMCMH